MKKQIKKVKEIYNKVVAWKNENVYITIGPVMIETNKITIILTCVIVTCIIILIKIK